MTKNDWIIWIKQQQPELDNIIAQAGLAFFEFYQREDSFWYDIKCCQEESYNLSRGKDLCYDRVSTPLTYSLWYQGRRINTFLSHFIDQLIGISSDRYLDIFDLGAGTGAVQMSLGLVYAKLARDGNTVPRLRIFNVDTSPFMLSYNRDYIWPKFLSAYPEAKNIFVEYHVNSWNNPENLELASPWISASYLFDISDEQQQIRNDFLDLLAKFKPAALLLLTSDQPKKRSLLNNLVSELRHHGWDGKNESIDQLIFNGEMLKVNALRNHYSSIAGISSLSRSADWRDYSFISSKITKLQTAIAYNRPNSNQQHINLYNPPLKIRRDILLSDDQMRAAVHSSRPCVIIGPAGCGKSVVITERIINIIKANAGVNSPEILLTTFNKGLLSKLSEWLLELLNSHKLPATIKNDVNSSNSPIESCTITGSSTPFKVRLLHFDMLPKFIGGIDIHYYNQTHHEQILKSCIASVAKFFGVKIEDYSNILNADFLMEEYHRVIYGLQCRISDGLEAYQNISRRGRGNNPSLQKGLRRELVWHCLRAYGKAIFDKNLQSFTTRRQELIYKLRNGQIAAKFDYLIVDEFQDCTQADFEIFWGLLKNKNNFIIAGDIAQAVHIGRSATIPREESMAQRQVFRLKGSYRLPQRISECILGLSKKIKESSGQNDGIEEITPYKGSPPGARPIVIYGTEVDDLAIKIKSAVNRYKVFGIKKITILEKDSQLCNEMKRIGIDAETDTILKLKGLEKECIIWYADVPINFEKEVKEFVYTILTRTSCILIVAFTHLTPDYYKGIFSLLDQEKLIFWNKESEDNFLSMKKPFREVNGADEELS